MSRNNRFRPNSRLVRLLVFTVLTASFLVYLAIYLSQPSLFGLTDEEGATYTRFLDLFVLPSLLPGMWGDGTQPPAVLDRLPILGAAILWLAVAWRLGRALMHHDVLVRDGCCVGSRGRRRWSPDALLIGGWQLLVGLAWLSSLVLVLGLAHGLGSRWPLLVAVVVSLLGAEWLGRRQDRWAAAVQGTGESHGQRPNRRRGTQGPAAEEPSSSVRQPTGQDIVIDTQFARWLRRLLPVMVVMLFAAFLLGSMVPPWEFDVLEYHLQAPKEFHLQGAIGFNEHNVYANMPLGAEMHALAAMVLIGGAKGWWYGGLVGKTILGCYSWIMAAMAGAWMAKRGGAFAGWSAAGLTLANIGHAHEAMSGLIDMAMAAYLLATVLFLAAVDWTAARRGGWRWGLALGMLSGGAAACKYPGVVLVLLPALVVAVLLTVRNGDRRLTGKLVLGLGLGASLTVGAWLAKNMVLTGNPVYPMLGQWWGAPAMTPAAIERWNRAHSPFATTEHPFSLAQVLDSAARLTFRSPFLNPGTMFLAAVGCGLVVHSMCGRRSDMYRMPTLGLGWWAWILLVWWFLTHRIDRFWLPALPLMAMHATWAARWMAQRVSSSLALMLVVFSQALALVQMGAGAGPIDNRFFVSLNWIEREALDERISSVVNPATAWVNRNLNADDLLLCIGEAKAYLYRVPILYATCFNLPPGQAWLQEASPQEQWERLRAAGVTHVMIDWSEIERYRSPGNYGFSAWPAPSDFDRMVQGNVLQRLDTPFDPRDVDILRVADESPAESDRSTR